MHLRRMFAAPAVAAALILGLGGCSTAQDQAEAPSSSSSSSTAALEGTITVFAAASLKATFTEIAQEFEAHNPE